MTQVDLALPAPTDASRASYGARAARKDLLAGVTVAAISLPQAMAYALIAGVDPRFGLYSAIVVTTIASIFGSSSHLINGPTNAISLVVFSSLAFLDPDARFDVAQATVRSAKYMLWSVIVAAISAVASAISAAFSAYAAWPRK